ncbi:MOXD1 like 2 [Pseudolycoriella hygida]|uniref:MOXD1 like 2 n=1 Tax=Pseudolycoriella hygida TaxID=35572 RepID=A0A9Q0NAF7_9DIPT|nr:MOXD1 like 2 [Pseudolycoriella hygida]
MSLVENDTMRVIYMYHESEPQRGLLIPGNLPNPEVAFRGYRSLFLTQKPQQHQDVDPNMKIMELRNQDVELPLLDDTLYWCKMFKLQDINQKSHVIKYEPVFDSVASIPYMQHIILYECQGSSPDLELMSREQGRPCYRPNNPPLSCNAIVATWAKGSEGFSFPLEAGYALDSTQSKFYMMETHYNNPLNTADSSKSTNRQKADNSGLRLYYTNNLRKHDAGVLSIGMDPNWRHIIPPFQEKVVSEGHCIEDCTRKGFPRQGISIFAVMMRTHLIGRQIKLRHIRNDEEFPPIAYDKNIDPNYQEYRRLPSAVRTMPGDRLISECTYDSSSRDQITLGGITTREESCIVLTYYYPRQKKLTTCHSLPSLPTVLHSLGIQELAIGSNPVLIASPPELAGMTLESRLVTYDWKNQFKSFQQVTRRGSFKAICWDAKNILIPVKVCGDGEMW